MKLCEMKELFLELTVYALYYKCVNYCTLCHWFYSLSHSEVWEHSQ